MQTDLADVAYCGEVQLGRNGSVARIAFEFALGGRTCLNRDSVDANVFDDAGVVENLFSFQTLLINKDGDQSVPHTLWLTQGELPAGLAAACAWKETRTSFPCPLIVGSFVEVTGD